MLKLYSYFRSSASFRVRIALNLKGASFDYVPVHLLHNGGEQLSDGYRAVHPGGLVPALDDDGHIIQQSLAIVEYLDEVIPEPALLPAKALDRAYVRSIAQHVACDIHPLNNLRILKYLKRELQVSEEQKTQWYRHWIDTGFASLETMLATDTRTGSLTFGDQPTIADICIVPQVWNAMRINIPLTAYPTVSRIYQAAMEVDAFAKAAPEVQPDAE